MTNALETLDEVVRRTHSSLHCGQLQNPRETMIIAAMGMAEEASETLGIIKKHVEQARKIDYEKLKLEMFDNLYYIQLMSIGSGISIEDCIAAGKLKLEKRFPTGFSPEAALKRIDTVD